MKLHPTSIIGSCQPLTYVWALFAFVFLLAARPASAQWLPLLKCWGGFWGLVIHGGPEHAYTVESLRQSPDRQVERHGFQLHAARNCFSGMLGILVLERELAPTRGPEAVASGWCIHES